MKKSLSLFLLFLTIAITVMACARQESGYSTPTDESSTSDADSSSEESSATSETEEIDETGLDVIEDDDDLGEIV